MTVFPAMLFITVEQERTACPSTCTVQAPQSAIPQPNLVPVSPTTSRRTQSSGISGATSTVRDAPFRVKVMLAMFSVRGDRQGVDQTMGGGSRDVKTRRGRRGGWRGGTPSSQGYFAPSSQRTEIGKQAKSAKSARRWAALCAAWIERRSDHKRTVRGLRL